MAATSALANVIPAVLHKENTELKAPENVNMRMT